MVLFLMQIETCMIISFHTTKDQQNPSGVEKVFYKRFGLYHAIGNQTEINYL